MLRLKNIHHDLDGGDLNDLFVTIAPVDFIKFDPRESNVAYVCFQKDFAVNNARAISQFDGKKAMGNVLIVENATSLADRIAPQRVAPERRSERNEHPRERSVASDASRQRAKKAAKPKKPRPAKKTAEELDSELTAYMDGLASNEPAASTSAEPTGAFPAQSNGENMAD